VPDHTQDEPRIVRSEDIPEAERERRIAESLRSIGALTDGDIDFSDIPEITDWSNAIRGWFSDAPHVEIRLRIDRETLRWILGEYGEFQTSINDALRSHMNSQIAKGRGMRS
jgi:uncharacterized protein (DUF4415 family)